MVAENRPGQSSYRKSCPISIYDVAAVETWLEDLALRVEAELRTWQAWYGGGEPERLEVPGLDSFWWAGDDPPSQRDDPCQCVVARRRNCVLMFSYTGHTDLRTMGEDFAALLGAEKGESDDDGATA